MNTRHTMKNDIEILSSVLTNASARITSAYNMRGEVLAAIRKDGHLSTTTFAGGAKKQSFGEEFPDVDNAKAAMTLLRSKGTPVNEESVKEKASAIATAKAAFSAMKSMAKAFGITVEHVHSLAKELADGGTEKGAKAPETNAPDGIAELAKGNAGKVKGEKVKA